MKIGVDAVLLGCWTGKGDIHSVMDIGCGCGIISLILAQRFPEAIITAIDCDRASIEESTLNFRNSPFKERLDAFQLKFPEDIIEMGKKFDLIVSNPPFFKSGILHPSTPREKARHQDELNVFSLIEHADDLLNDNGTLSMIFPYEYRDEVILKANSNKLIPVRECRIKGRESRPVKRVMMEFRKAACNDEIKKETNELILYTDTLPTDSYKNLCRDFYLKF